MTNAPLNSLPLVTLYLTERCNSRCISCDYWRHGKADLSVESAARMLPDFERLGTRVVLISGGEPLLNPHWAEIASLLKSRGMTLWLLTSGLSLAKHASRAAQLFQTITVSLDGADRATYAAIRGLDAFDRVCLGIHAVTGRQVPTSLRVTVQRANFRQLANLVDLAKQLGVQHISFLAADVASSDAFGRIGQPTATLSLTSDDLSVFDQSLTALTATHANDFASGFIAESPAKLRRLLQYYSALCGRGDFPPVRCNAPEFSAVVEAGGRVRPCFFIAGTESIAANPQVDATLNSPGMIKLRASIRAGERAECRTCVCSMWRDPARFNEHSFP